MTETIVDDHGSGPDLDDFGAGPDPEDLDVEVVDLDEADDTPTEPPAAPPDLTRWRSWLSAFVVTGAALAVFWRLQPGLVLADTTPTGGDMGAHVWGPAYLRDHLLGSLRLSGWTMDWYAGFPALQFYMPLPYLLIVLLDVFLPYGVAFKLVAVSGVVGMPVAAWAFGRLARVPFPGPPIFAVAAAMYVFDTNWSIYGGNIASTLAGEFAFSIALSLALVTVGLAARGIETGRHRGAVAVLLAVTAMSHLIPAFFAAVAIGVLVVVRSWHRLGLWPGLPFAVVASTSATLAALIGGGWIGLVVGAAVIAVVLIGTGNLRRAWWVVSAGATSAAVAALWLLPFLGRRTYLNDMGWERIVGDDLQINLVDTADIGDGKQSIYWLLVLAGLGLVLAVLSWDLTGLWLGGIGVTFAVLFVNWPIERLWNARLLPFWFLAVYLLAGYALATLARLLMDGFAGPWSPVLQFPWPLLVGTVALAYTSFTFGALPGGRTTETGAFRWGPFERAAADQNFVDGWARWNFEGYERKNAYPEYFDLVDTMAAVGAERGCGRALWEFGRDHLNRYGTPMAPMLLPHWTDGCIASMEGLYFESSTSVPWHFHMQSEVSANPSRPMRGLEYRGLTDDGISELAVEHMQMMGVRYYIGFSEEALGEFGSGHGLQAIAFSDPWVVYEVPDAEVVSPLRYEPNVAPDLGPAQDEWVEPVEDWFLDATANDVHVALDGPDSWARVELIEGDADGEGAEFGPLSRVELPPVTVTDIELGDESVRFTVDRVGVPVLVKVSYFPNWNVSGADGPYRVTPNLMVVVPTDTEVELTYGRTWTEWGGLLLSLVGVAVVVGFVRRRDMQIDDTGFLMVAPTPTAEAETAPDGDPAATTTLDDFWAGARAEGPDWTSRAAYGDPVGAEVDWSGERTAGGGDPVDDAVAIDGDTEDADGATRPD